MKDFIDPDSMQDPEAPVNQPVSQWKDPDDTGPNTVSKKKKDKSSYPLITGFTRPIEEFAEGTIQAGLKGAQAIGIPTEGAQEALGRVRAEREAEYAQAVEEAPIATRAGYFTGMAGLGAAVPGGVGGKVGTRVATGALAGAGIGAGQYVDEGGSRLQNTLIGSMVGGTIPALLGAGKGLFGALRKVEEKVIPGPAAAAKTIQKAIATEGAQSVEDLVQAGQRAGIPLTPGEATGYVPLRAKEGRLVVSAGNQPRVAEFLRGRQEASKEAVSKMVSGIVGEGDDIAAANATKLYEQVRDVPLPSNKLQELMQDPIIAKNMDQLVANVDYRADQFGANSVGRFNELKKFLDAKIAKGKLEGSVNRNLTEARSNLVNALDEAAPEYAAARKISQRLILKRQYQDDISNIALQPHQSEPTASQIYSKLFNTSAKQDEFISNIELAGGSPGQAKDLLRVLNAIDKSAMDKLLTKDVEQKSVQFGAGVGARLTETGMNFLRGRYNKALLELSLNPQWSKEVAKIAKDGPTKTPKLANQMGALLAKILAQQADETQ